MALPTDGELRTTLDLSIAAKVHGDRVLRDLHAGKIEAGKYGRDYLFTPTQFEAARSFYRKSGRVKRHGRKPSGKPAAGDGEGGRSDQGGGAAQDAATS